MATGTMQHVDDLTRMAHLERGSHPQPGNQIRRSRSALDSLTHSTQTKAVLFSASIALCLSYASCDPPRTGVTTRVSRIIVACIGVPSK